MNHLVEAWRRLTAEDYWGGHRPSSDAPPLHDLLEGDSWFPQDVYTHPHYYVHSNERYDRESVEVVLRVKGKPNAQVTIYRSIPPTAEPMFHTGDWVAISETYARQHGMDRGWEEWVEHPTSDEYPMGGIWDRREGDWTVLATQVSADSVRNGGNDLVEWGYFGPSRQGRVI